MRYDDDTDARIAAMKNELQQLRMDDALVKNCLDAAKYAGLPEGELYLLLAYHAVKELRRFKEIVLDLELLRPRSVIIYPPEHGVNADIGGEVAP